MIEDGFMPQYYLDIHEDVRTVFGPNNIKAATKHYREHGIAEGRTPNPFFFPTYYLSQYPDLQKAFGKANVSAALRHWVEYGIREGRRGSHILDPQYYLRQNPDVQIITKGNYPGTYDHFIRIGYSQLRYGADYAAMTGNNEPAYLPDGRLNPKGPCYYLLELRYLNSKKIPLDGGNAIDSEKNATLLWEQCIKAKIIRPNEPVPNDPRSERDRVKEFDRRFADNAAGERNESRIRDGREYA